MRQWFLMAAFLALSACTPICDEPNEHNKPGWPTSDVEHLGFFGMPQTVAPEPIATIERIVEYNACP